MTINHVDSIRGKDGRILFYGSADFIRDICLGDRCFICGASPDDVEFNDEHVVSDWLLRRFEQHQIRLQLPNRTYQFYGRHKLPCCVDCNTLLGRAVENPVSKLTELGHAALLKSDRSVSGPLLAQWLTQTFFKLMLMDGRLPNSRDRRSGDTSTIAGDREWQTLHHLHALVRVPFTGAQLSPAGLYGSLLTFPMDEGDRSFDLLTYPTEQTIFVQVGDLGMILVIGDDQRVVRYHSDFLGSIGSGPFSTLQARELATRFAYTNGRFIERPQFRTLINHDTDRVIIQQAAPPSLAMLPFGEQEFADSLSEALYGATMIQDGKLLTTFASVSIPGTLRPLSSANS